MFRAELQIRLNGPRPSSLMAPSSLRYEAMTVAASIAAADKKFTVFMYLILMFQKMMGCYLYSFILLFLIDPDRSIDPVRSGYVSLRK
jgi:hypothetical protein